jgi:hypothetical protein
MSNICSIKVSSPPRGLTPGANAVFTPAEAVLTWSWGLQPATALVEWVSAADIPAIVAGSSIEISLGDHVFYGITDNFVRRAGSDGFSTVQEFQDNRWFLMKDVIYAAFNVPDARIINGQYLKRYKHLLPVDYNTNAWSFTVAPYSAQQILNFCFGAATVQSPWVRTYHAALGKPVFDLDYSNGQKLGQVLVDVAEKLGLVFTLMGGPYSLVWALKGVGALPGFPAASDARRIGSALSSNPTRIRLLGDRNKYQVLNCSLIPDWLPAWQAFWNFNIFIDDIFLNEVTDAPLVTGNASTAVPMGTAYAALPGDPDHVIGYQLATARAKSLTVAQYAALRDARAGDGNQFRDYRRVQGRSRLQLPVALYLAQLLFRAFKLPDNFVVSAGNGLRVNRYGYELDATPVVEVTHDPVTGWLQPRLDSGGNYMVPESQHNGYAIVQGYQVNQDGFGTLNPDYFDYNAWISGQALWQFVPYQIDESGEGTHFVLFDEPVINSGDLIRLANQVSSGQWLATLTAHPTFVTPPVKASLTFLGERFSWIQGNGQLDDVENVGGVAAQYVALRTENLPTSIPGVTVPGSSTPAELPYADGQRATEKAAVLASLLLNRQLYYQNGGYLLAGLNAQELTETVDRVTLRWNAATGISKEVDFTNERSRNVSVGGRGEAVLNLEPERVYERRSQLDSLFPGQEQLRTEARQAKLAAVALRQNPRQQQSLVNTFHLLLGQDAPPLTVFTDTLGETDATVLAGGTPLFKSANKNVCWKPDDAGPAQTDPPVFVGVTTLDGQGVAGGVQVTAAGAGNVILARLKLLATDQPAAGSNVGFPLDKVARTAMELHPSLPVGALLDDWSKNAVARTVLTRVRVAGGGGGGGFINEYNPARAYNTSESFTVSRVVTVAGKTLGYGVWSVPIAETDVDGNTWTGNLPANVTAFGTAVAAGALLALAAPAPTDGGPQKFYAKRIVAYCTE